MTKIEAIHSLTSLSHGTLGTLTGLSKYEDLDKVLTTCVSLINFMDVSKCKTWQDVWNTVYVGVYLYYIYINDKCKVLIISKSRLITDEMLRTFSVELVPFVNKTGLDILQFLIKIRKHNGFVVIEYINVDFDTRKISLSNEINSYALALETVYTIEL